MASQPEIWRPVLGFERCYEVSNLGRVRSVGRWSRGRFRAGTIRKPSRRGRYLGLILSDGRRRETRSVHRLVAEAFHGAPPEGAVACHRNGIRDDNRAENLRWDTPAGNVRDAIRHGTHQGNLGERKNLAKISPGCVARIRDMIAARVPQTQIGLWFGLSQSTISNIATGKLWRHTSRHVEVAGV